MGRVLGYLAPGFLQIRRGKWVEGVGALALWIGLLGLTVARFDQVSVALVEDTDDRVALVALVLLLVGVWVWSRWEDRGAHRRSESGEDVLGPGTEGWWRAFKKNRAALFGLGIVILLFLAALLGPFLAPFDPLVMPAYEGSGELDLLFAPPSSTNLMGRDHLSRDVFSRILFGARISLTIGILAVGISITLGTLIGAVSGYLGGWADTTVMRLVDMVMAFPRIVFLIAVVAVFEPSILLIVVTLALTEWPFTARLVRGEILSLKEREFTEAARALGFSRSRILFRHLLPNTMAPIIVAATLGIGHVILLEAGLSFLGFGVSPPQPSWGTMVADGRGHLFSQWWISTFPGLVLAFSVLAFNLVGDGLRDALDPRQDRRTRP